MGSFATAISSISGALIIVVLFVLLNVRLLRHRHKEVTYSLYGVFAGMVLNFFWIGQLHLDNAENRQVVVSQFGASSVLLLVVVGIMLHERRRVPLWLFALVWGLQANMIPPIILSYLSLFGAT